MRYILNSEGYIYDIAFGTEIECDLGTSTLYAGEVPTGYSTLEEWLDGEIDKLNAWKIVEGNLVFDNARYNELQSEWEKEAIENKQIVKKDLKNIEQMLTSASDTNKSQYVSDSTDGKIITVSNASNIFPSVKVTDIDPYSYNKLDFIITGKNMLPNTAYSLTENGVTITQNEDRSLTLSGELTKENEQEITSENIILEDIDNTCHIEELKIYGKSTQATRSGKNKLDANNPTSNNNARVQFSDDIITISSNATNTTPFVRWEIDTPEDRIYKIRFAGILLTSKARVVISYYANDKWNYLELNADYVDGTTISRLLFSAPAITTKVGILLYSDKDIPTTSSSSQYKNVIVTVDNDDMSYEPYGVMPSPDYPSEIECVKGKNLFDENNMYNGYYEMDTGSLVSNDAYRTMIIDNLPSGTYMFSTTLANCRLLRIWYDNKSHEISSNKTIQNFTTITNSKVMLSFQNQSSTVITETFKTMVEKGTVATDYLPYNTIQVKDVGKNLYNDNFRDYTRPLDYLIHPITLEQGQAYTLKATLTGTKITGIIVGIVPTGEKYADFKTRLFVAINSGGNTEAKRTITIDETWTSPKLVVYCPPSSLQTTFESIFENYEIQLEKGTQSTTYEPYQENILNIDLQGNELCSLPNNVKDELVIENGRAKIIKRVGKVVLDGSENWVTIDNKNTGDTFYSATNVIDNLRKGTALNLYCDKFKNISNLWDNNNVVGTQMFNLGNALRFRILKTELNEVTINGWKSWLSTHNTIVYYVLATPVEINLGEVETLSTFNGVNNVSLDANISSELYLKYAKYNEFEYDIAGTSSNTNSILCIKKNTNYFLNTNDFIINMYYFNGIDRTLVYSGTGGLINNDNDIKATHITLQITKNTNTNNVTIFPQLELGIEFTTYEMHKEYNLDLDFSKYVGEALFPSDELFPSDSLYPQGTTISYIDVSNNEIKAFINDNMEYLGEGNIPIFEGCNTLYTLQDTFLHYEYSTNVLIYNPSRYGANEENPTLKSSYHYKDEWEVDGTTYTEEYTDDARFFSNGLKFVEDWSNDYPESTGYGKWKNIIELYNDYKFPFFELRKELDTGYWNSTTISPSGIDITDSENISYNSSTHIYRSGITTPTVTQTSLKESKKNFEKLNNALEIINDTDIYKYNLKYENDDDKKHIGFVIGDDFKYSKEITSLNNDGVDIYSMISVCFKAIQEQQMIIEKLENKIKELEVK